MNLGKLKCDTIIAECDKHIKRMNSAAEKIKDLIPLNENTYKNLSDEDVAYFDQFFFRFSKLQDAVGEKLFSSLLNFLKESNMKNRPFIDILNRMEQLELIDDKNSWLELRELRNELSHEYDDNTPEMIAAINTVFNKKHLLIGIYSRIKNYYLERIEKEKG